jgi:hypothetical protein
MPINGLKWPHCKLLRCNAFYGKVCKSPLIILGIKIIYPWRKVEFLGGINRLYQHTVSGTFHSKVRLHTYFSAAKKSTEHSNTFQDIFIVKNLKRT